MTSNNLITQPINSEIEQEIYWFALRGHRNELLSLSDKALMLNDLFTFEQIEEIKSWRQALRDLPSTLANSTLTQSIMSYMPTPPSCLVDKKGIFPTISIFQTLATIKFPPVNPVGVNTATSIRNELNGS